MSRGIKQDDDATQYWDLVRRIERLEAASLGGRTLKIDSPASVVDLGAIDGDGVTGVRLLVRGLFTYSSQNQPWWLQVNGLSALSNVQTVEQRAYWPHGGPLGSQVQGGAGSPPVSGANLSTLGGVELGHSDWGTTGTNAVTSDGVFSTTTGIGPRHYLGLYSNSDMNTNGDNFVTGRCVSQWYDDATVVSSLQVKFGGTFVGRVVVETIS